MSTVSPLKSRWLHQWRKPGCRCRHDVVAGVQGEVSQCGGPAAREGSVRRRKQPEPAASRHRTQHISVRGATGILRERHNTSKRGFDLL
jgi:hypothetical protein